MVYAMPDESFGRLHLRRTSSTKQFPVYFITICTKKRDKHLIVPHISDAIEGFFGNSEKTYGWQIGRYVIMPDHIHFFCSPISEELPLSDFIGRFKTWTTKVAKENGCGAKLWQREFFDHILRSGESYSKKWEYVRLNPVRAGLCQRPEEWKHQGEISIIERIG